MNGLSHKQARRYIHANLDGLLNDAQRLAIETHLAGCEACRIESESFSTLTKRLQSEFHERWDAQDGPSQNVITNVQSQTRRIAMSNKVNFGLRALAGIVALIVLGFGMNILISQLRNFSVASNPTAIPDNNMPVNSENANKRLLAFTKMENGNTEIYTMYADGSGLTNLTNNPAQDVSPSWSPDGKRIAFESDRNGLRQIFLMDVDGTDLVLLNDNKDKADQWIGEPYDLGLNIWSPDGNKLIFYEVAPGDEDGMLYVIDADGENKKPLVDKKGKYSSPSWSPDGRHIAFITIENNMARIYITDSNGSALTNVTKALPSDETLYPRKYSWSRDGRSISFVASNWDYLLGRGNGTTSNYKWTAYEANLNDNSLIVNASANSQMGGYWDGTYFLSGSAAISSSPEYKWVRSDGTSTTINPIEKCERAVDDNTGNYATGYSSFKQSYNGNVVIGAYCPNGDKWLFLANSKGRIIPLLNSPIHIQSAPKNAMNLWAPPDFVWSSDDQYIAFNLFSAGKTDMYIVNVKDAQKNPSHQPFHMTIGNISLYYSPIWQPVPPEEIIVEETTQKPLYDGLIAFTSSAKNGNLDIFTMHADGSEVTNITSNPANDSKPTWSPDGKRILFISERTGNADLFTMDSDGSNLKQLTNSPENDGSFSWSPNGKKIAYFSYSVNDSNISKIMLMNADGSGQVALTQQPGSYGYVGWSPDGQKFIYQKFDGGPGNNDNGYYVVSVDDQNHPEIRFDKNSWFHWEDTEHFLYSRPSGVAEQPQWSIEKFNIAGEQPLVPLTIAQHNAPAVAFFENTYVVEGDQTLTWYSTDGNSPPIRSWKFNEHCKQQGDLYITETGHTLSPDGKHAFVPVYCFDHTLWFYYESADGSEFKQLTDLHFATSSVLDRAWSPDGKYVVMAIAPNKDVLKTSLYLFDIQAMLKDSSVQPIQITSSEAVVGEGVWQPFP